VKVEDIGYVLKTVEKWGVEVNGSGRAMEGVELTKVYSQRGHIETPL
jgi:hypothetical protein